jgi:hypothetical protein
MPQDWSLNLEAFSLATNTPAFQASDATLIELMFPYEYGNDQRYQGNTFATQASNSVEINPCSHHK